MKRTFGSVLNGRLAPQSHAQRASSSPAEGPRPPCTGKRGVLRLRHGFRSQADRVHYRAPHRDALLPAPDGARAPAVASVSRAESHLFPAPRVPPPLAVLVERGQRPEPELRRRRPSRTAALWPGRHGGGEGCGQAAL